MVELPKSFLTSLQHLPGYNQELFEQSLNQPSPSSIRINPEKFTSTADLSKVPWHEHGFFLPERIPYALDPRWHAGAYYVQEASSMFLDHVLKELIKTHPDPVILDLCGAPGGKSTLISSRIGNNGFLVANEVIQSRAAVLKENLTRWGTTNFVVTQSDPIFLSRLKNHFDIIVADAPCSGEGMFRKEPNCINEWSPENVNLCAARQKRILADIWPALKPGGFLIYSTCSFNEKENEENLLWLRNEFSAIPVGIEVPPEWKIITSSLNFSPGYRFWIHRVAGEGLFMAIMQKPPEQNFTKKDIKSSKTKEIPSEFRDWILHPENFAYTSRSDHHYFFSKKGTGTIRALDNFKIKVAQPGSPLAVPKGKGFQPHPGLAFSTIFNRNKFPGITLNLQQALNFLSRLDPKVDSEKDKIHFFEYQGQVLGFANHVSNRWNNLYPMNWRLKKTIPPEIDEISQKISLLK